MAPMAATSSGAHSRARQRRRTARAPRATWEMPCWASWSASKGRSGGIMEDNANSVPLARVEFADAVIQLHLVVATHPFHRAAVDGEDGRVALPERQNHGASLHTRPLLGHYQLATFEVLARLIQQDRNLHREDMLAVEVTVETIVVLRRVLQE